MVGELGGAKWNNRIFVCVEGSFSGSNDFEGGEIVGIPACEDEGCVDDGESNDRNGG